MQQNRPFNIFRDAEIEELQRIHSENHISAVQAYKSDGKDNVCKIDEQWKTYTCDETYACALRSAGCCLALVDAFLDEKVIFRLYKFR